METDHSFDHHGSNSKVTLAVKVAEAKHNVTSPGQCGFVWLGGFKSDMTGTKAEAMVSHAAVLGCSSLRFDYSGHGASGGLFTDGTISRWVEESLAVLRVHTTGPQILVGSSMGGWIALRMVQELLKAGENNRIAGLLLIAPAPDFTKELMEPAFTADQRIELEEKGFIEEPSEYSDEPTIITQSLVEDGRNNLVLSSALNTGCPVSILQGMEDPDVPFEHALKLVTSLAQDNVTTTLIKDGDHRLSRDQDIALLRRTMTSMLHRIED